MTNCSRCGARPRTKGSWCQPCHNESQRSAWADKPVEVRKGKWLKHRYNKSYDWYVSTWEEQGRECIVCCEAIYIEGDHGPYKACVDHDHSTGEVRGLLCNHCNRAIGLIKDNPWNARRIVQYLEKDTDYD